MHIKRTHAVSMLAVCLVVFLFAPVASATSVTYYDGTFNAVDWGLYGFTGGGGGKTMAAQIGSGPGAYRYVGDWVYAAGPNQSSQIWGVHLDFNSIYDPLESGVIGSLDYSEDSIMTRGFGEGEATGIAVAQGGNVYISINPRLLANQGSWTHQGVAGLSELNFIYLGSLSNLIWNTSGAYHPDFTGAAGELVFGFFRANSAPQGGGAYDIEGGIDNWTVRVNQVPEPLSVSLLGTALAFAGPLARRRKKGKLSE